MDPKLSVWCLFGPKLAGWGIIGHSRLVPNTIFITMYAWFSLWISWLAISCETRAQKLETDIHDMIFWSFFLFLKLTWFPVKNKSVLWPLFSDHWILVNIVNIWITLYFREPFCTIKRIQLTLNAWSYPERVLKTIYKSWFIQWVELLPC